jgi:hypothetical protein
MATCPRCKAFLDEDHVCKRQVSRAVWWASSVALATLTGAIVGYMSFAFAGRVLNVPGLEAVGLVVGPLAAFVLIRSLRQW